MFRRVEGETGLNSIEKLVLQLRHPIAHMREAAALELVLLADQQTQGPLLEALQDRDADVRRTVIQALAGLNTPEVVAAIFPLLQDPEPRVAQAAYDAMVKMGPLAAPFLLEHLEHPDWVIRVLVLDVFQAMKQYCPLERVLELLKAPEWEVREAATRFLGGIRDKKVTSDAVYYEHVLTALLEVLHTDEDREVRMAACRSLGNMGDARVTEPLLLVMRQSEDESLQMAAAEGLAMLGPLVSEVLVHQALQDHRAPVRALGAQILGHVRDVSALQPLIENLQDDSRAVRMAAALALSQIQPQEPLWVLLYHMMLGEPEISPEAVVELGQSHDKRAIPYLLDEIPRVPPEAWREVLITALGELGDMETILPLSIWLKAPEPAIRAATAWALGRIGHLLAVEYLVPCLGEQDPQVLYQVVESLRHLEPLQELWPTLLKILSPEPEDRLEGLSQLPHPLEERLKPFLLNLLSRETIPAVQEFLIRLLRPHPEWIALQDWLARLDPAADGVLLIAILENLQNFSDLEPEPCLPVLLRLLESRDEAVREAVIQVLLHLGSSVVSTLLQHLEHELWFVRQALIRVLGSLGSPEALLPLLKALTDRDRDVRVAVALALGQMGDRQAAEPLVKALENGFRDVRAAAAQALAQMNEPWVVDALQTALIEDEAAEVRAEAAHALGQLGAEPALADLLEALAQDEEVLVRVASAEALGQIGHPAAVQGLLAALKDDSSEVGMAAIRALGRLAYPVSLETLAEILEFGTRDLRAATAAAFGEMRLPDAVPLLVEALQDEALAVRQAAVVALGQLADERACMPLIALLLENQAELNSLLVEALIALGPVVCYPLLEQLPALSQEQVPVVIHILAGVGGCAQLEPILERWQQLPEALQLEALVWMPAWKSPLLTETLLAHLRRTENHELRLALVETLVQLQAAEGMQSLLLNWDQEIKQLAVRALARMGEVGLEMLVEAFATPDDILRLLILQSVAEIRHPRVLALLHRVLSLPSLGLLQAALHALLAQGVAATPILREALDHPERSIRQLAARSLLKLYPEESLWRSLASINSQSQEQRVRAAQELEHYPSSESAAALMRALEDESRWVRRQAALSLGQLKVNQSRPLLRQALKDWHHDVREAAVMALGQIADPQDFEALRDLLVDPDIRVREAVLRVLARTGDTQCLSQACQDPFAEVRRTAVQILGELQAREALSLLLEMLGRDPEASVRDMAAWSLGQLALPEVLEPLLQALEDPAVEVRWAAVEALGKLGDVQAVEPLLEILSAGAEEYLVDMRLQQLAIVALGALGDLRAVPCLIEAVRKPSWGDQEIRRLALQALTQLRAEQAVPVLSDLARNGPAELAEQATAAVRAIQTALTP